MSKTYETAESVAMGHPDKMADQISDAILDAHLRQDQHSRVACETLIKGDSVVVAGEITSKADVNIDKVVRETIKHIGYTDRASGFELTKPTFPRYRASSGHPIQTASSIQPTTASVAMSHTGFRL